MDISSDDPTNSHTNVTTGENSPGETEILSREELVHGHKVTGSQSSIDYEKFGDSRRRGTAPRSKSFLEETSRAKTSLFMQRKPGGKGKGIRSTFGSYGDGICPGAPWDSNKGLALNDSVDKGGDQEKKLQVIIRWYVSSIISNPGASQHFREDIIILSFTKYGIMHIQAGQTVPSAEKLFGEYFNLDVFSAWFLIEIVITDCSVQAAGVTQKLFDSKVTFADLVRVCSSQDNPQQTNKAQLGNTLLSTAHASTLVSNYLNTYRSYLDQLRKTCGRGDSLGEAISSRTCIKSVPLVLPLARMTPVFSDDSREDPEFLELLKKTTTESIRKLWPHPNKTNIVRKAGLSETNEDKREECVSMTVNTVDILVVTEDNSEQSDNNSPAVPTDSCEKSDVLDDAPLTDCEQCTLYDSNLLLEDVESSMNNQNHNMKSVGEPLVLSDGGSANNMLSKTSAGPVQKGLLKVPNDNLTSGDNFYRHCQDTSGQAANNANWSESGQTKCPGESLNQQSKHSSLDVFLKHQQKLLQQQQLQRQILQHQQQQQQRQQQQQQLIEQYQQQEQQRQQSSNKNYAFPTSDPSKGWFQAIGSTSESTSPKSRLAVGNLQSSTYSSSSMPTGHGGMDVFGNGNQQSNTDYFPSNNLQGMSTLGGFMENQQTTGFSELPASNRTLKASYACLDPSNPMTLSVEPLHDYSSDRDAYVHQGDRQGSFGQAPDEKPPCTESSRSWAEMSRPAYDSDPLSSSTLEDRLIRAYARSRISQLGQATTGTDSARQPVQRPILKINPSMESNQENQTFGAQTFRGGFDPVSRNNSDAGFDLSNRNGADPGYDDFNARYRWNNLTSCSAQTDIPENNAVSNNSSGERCEMEDNFMHLQPNDQSSRVSRLYQWKQNMLPANDVPYLPSNRSSAESSRLNSNDNIPTSLLASLQTDRDFSWNASPMGSSMSSLGGQSALCADQQVFGSASMSGQYKFSDAYLNKVSAYPVDQRRQISGNPYLMGRNQSEQIDESSVFYDGEDSRQNTWSWKGRQTNIDEAHSLRGNTSVCGPMLSQSMQILNNKILAAQTNPTSGRKSSENDDKSKEDENLQNDEDIQQSDMTKLRLSRAFSDPTTANSIFRPSPHTSASMSQLTVLQQQQQQHHQQQQQQQQQANRQKSEDTVYKLSEELEKTYLDNPTGSTPWHEMPPDNCSQDYDADNNGASDKYVQVQSFDGSTMILSDQELAALRSNSSNRMYSNTKEQLDQTQAGQASRNQDQHRPRMILGANSLKQQSNDDKVKAEVEESNRRLREMLGLFPNKEQTTCSNSNSMRMQDNVMSNQQTASLVMNTQMQGMMQQNSSHNMATNQMTRMQMAGGKLQAPMGMTQQMYCVPNILMPPQSVQNANPNRQSNLVGVMTSASRFPQGMIRVPFVDMLSRVVYVHQMPVNMSSAHPNNNHNNSSSSNPHVNTSNIITINTNDNDFSANGQNDKTGRPIRSNTVKNKATFIKMRSGSEEFSVPVLGMRPSLDDSVCPRLIKTRTNPWDQDLDHDFSNSLMSKAVSMENITGVCTSPNIVDPNICNPEMAMMYPDLTPVPSSNPVSSDQPGKTATYMQWPASADMHPEMLDMLPVRRAMPEDCGSGRLCWPEMEFLMSSREQLQTARRSNKPMGSNKANLISIIPKGNGTEGMGCGGKETRFDKPETKF